MKYAVIDIGSNSIRYMEQDSNKKLVITTRLGEGLASTGCLQSANMLRSISVISALASNARHAGFHPVAYATSAVRDANNQKEFLDAVHAASGIMPDVLSGEREAVYAFRAAAEDGGGLIDIGGASMQFVSDGFGISFPVGCVRGRDIALARTNAVDCDDNWTAQRNVLNNYMSEIVCAPKIRIDNWVGVGGSITTLAALKLGSHSFESKTVDGTLLTRDDVECLITHLGILGSDRRNHPLLSVRHDVILYGAAILAFAMDTLGLPRITAVTRDGMDGYLQYKMQSTN